MFKFLAVNPCGTICIADDLCAYRILKTELFVLFCLCRRLKGLRKLWMLGDNFIAETYKKFFKKASNDFFMKEQFEVMPFCSSKFSDRNTNMLSRILNSLITALNSKSQLPDYLLVILDNDLIKYLGCKKFGVPPCMVVGLNFWLLILPNV